MAKQAATKLRTYRGHDASIVGNLEPQSPSIEEQAAWTSAQRVQHLSNIFQWYNYTQDDRVAVDWLADWLEARPRRQQLAALVRKQSQVNRIAGWLCRASQLGLQLNLRELRKIHQSLAQLITQCQKKPQASNKNRRLQDAEQQHRRYTHLCTHLEQQLDQFIGNQCTGAADFAGTIAGSQLSNTALGQLAQRFRSLRAELEQAHAGADDQLTEAYAHLTQRQLKSTVRWLTAVCQQLSSAGDRAAAKIAKNTAGTKKTKAVRQPRSQRPERMVAGLRYQQRLETPDITSVPATQLLGAAELWTYDVKRRLLSRYVASAGTGLSVRGTRLLDFDASQSQTRTLRKPETQLPELQGLSRAQARRWFAELSTRPRPATERPTASTLLLRVHR